MAALSDAVRADADLRGVLDLLVGKASMATLTPPAPTALPLGGPEAEGDLSARRNDGIIGDIAEQHANELHHPNGA